MKCKCTLNNSYEVIGPCDLEEFNQKISEFEDESWNQVNISKLLTIDSNKPSVKNILKTYLDIKITSNEIIETPKANVPNIEGFNSTGKMLLVLLEIQEKIIYSDDCSQNIHSIEFKNNFSTYITLDENVNPKKDKYSVYPFIENISLNLLNPKNINRTIQLFLFAHKIELNPQINIPNEFIFYDSKAVSKRQVAKVSFNSMTKVLEVTSTGNLYRASNINFALKNSRGNITRAEGTLTSNEDGSEFKSKLNGQKFKVNDLIFINYLPNNNTSVLTNYPKAGDTYDMSFLNDSVFKITKDGIVPYLIPNVISLKTFVGNLFNIHIGFDIFSKTFLTSVPDGQPTNPSFPGEDYFKVIIKNSNLEEKYQSSIKSNGFPFDMARYLLGKTFEYGDIIELIYKEGNKVQISNTPYPSADSYTLTGTNKSFRITKNGLVEI